jgi:hypothetical protein
MRRKLAKLSTVMDMPNSNPLIFHTDIPERPQDQCKRLIFNKIAQIAEVVVIAIVCFQ